MGLWEIHLEHFSYFIVGESHGGGIGVVIDGCPPCMDLCEEDIQPFLDAEDPAKVKITTPCDEADKVEILSGTFEGKL